MRIVARQMSQHMKHIFRVGVDGIKTIEMPFNGISVSMLECANPTKTRKPMRLLWLASVVTFQTVLAIVELGPT
jgi:hypothetical protein